MKIIAMILPWVPEATRLLNPAGQRPAKRVRGPKRAKGRTRVASGGKPNGLVMMPTRDNMSLTLLAKPVFCHEGNTGKKLKYQGWNTIGISMVYHWNTIGILLEHPNIGKWL